MSRFVGLVSHLLSRFARKAGQECSVANDLPYGQTVLFCRETTPSEPFAVAKRGVLVREMLSPYSEACREDASASRQAYHSRGVLELPALSRRPAEYSFGAVRFLGGAPPQAADRFLRQNRASRRSGPASRLVATQFGTTSARATQR